MPALCSIPFDTKKVGDDGSLLKSVASRISSFFAKLVALKFISKVVGYDGVRLGVAGSLLSLLFSWCLHMIDANSTLLAFSLVASIVMRPGEFIASVSKLRARYKYSRSFLIID